MFDDNLDNRYFQKPHINHIINCAFVDWCVDFTKVEKTLMSIMFVVLEIFSPMLHLSLPKTPSFCVQAPFSILWYLFFDTSQLYVLLVV